MAKKKTTAVSEVRADLWENASTGFGVLGRDKRLTSEFSADIIPQRYAEEIWRGDDMAARAVETVPNEMLRAGYEVEVEGDKELSEALETEDSRLKISDTVLKALYFGRAYGGAGILLGADDGSKDLSLPLAEDRIRSFDWTNLLSPAELQAHAYYSNPTAPKYGEVATYRIVPLDAVPGASLSTFPLVHESRIVRFGGVETSRGSRLRNVNPGWDDSIFVRILQVLTDFQNAWAGTSILLSDFAPPVLKLKNLAQLLATESGQALAERARGIEISRSIARTTILDTEEEYTRQTVNVTGLPELLEKMMLRLAAAVQIPVSLLMGQSPAGLNATGDADTRWFYDQIAAAQERFLEPPLRRIFEIVLKSKAGPSRGKVPENWDVEFEPLWQMTDLEQAQLRKTQAETDAIYIQAQVVTPQEISKSRFGGDGYSTSTTIDVELRDALLEDEELQLEELGAATVQDTAQDTVQVAQVDNVDYIEQRGSKWLVLSTSGEVLGEHDTKEAAIEQLRAIEAAKAAHHA